MIIENLSKYSLYENNAKAKPSTCNAKPVSIAVPRASAVDDARLLVSSFCCKPQSDLGWHVRHTLLLDVVDKGLCPWSVISQLQRKNSYWCKVQMFGTMYTHQQFCNSHRSNALKVHHNMSTVKVKVPSVQFKMQVSIWGSQFRFQTSQKFLQRCLWKSWSVCHILIISSCPFIVDFWLPLFSSQLMVCPPWLCVSKNTSALRCSNMWDARVQFHFLTPCTSQIKPNCSHP